MVKDTPSKYYSEMSRDFIYFYIPENNLKKIEYYNIEYPV